MKAGVLFSGGKDSCYALYWALNQGYEMKCLITLLPKHDSYMFHGPNISLAKVQAKAIGLPIIEQKTKAEKEIELDDLSEAINKAIKKYKIEAIVVGALASDYQFVRVNRVCESLGIKVFAPLWHKNQEILLRDVVNSGIKAIFVAVAAEGLDEKWLGREIDGKTVEELVKLNKKTSLSIMGEGGEFETFVLDAPFFQKEIVVEKTDKKMESLHSGKINITKYKFLEK
ncbi:MAG: diphthine--ammonia ligase [Candidatus Woesearchaeota archaeon]